MLFKMRPIDGRLNFYQWDTNRRLTVPDGITAVHFYNDSNPDETRSVSVTAGSSSIAVPDELLMSDGFLVAIPYDGALETGNWSKYTQRFRIVARPKPSDYKYISTDELQNEIYALRDELKDAVKYTEQTRSDDEKAIARENINAFDKYNGLTPVECAFSASNIKTVYTNGTFNFPNYAENDFVTMMKLQLLFTGASVPETESGFVATLLSFVESGLFGEDFWEVATYTKPIIIQDAPVTPWLTARFWASSLANKKVGVRISTSDGYRFEAGYSATTGQFDSGITYNDTYMQVRTYNMNADPSLPQTKMAADPTEAMHIATKQYVDNKVVKPFLVSLLYENDITYHADKTFAQILAAYNVGQQINVELSNYPGIQSPLTLSLAMHNGEQFVFSATITDNAHKVYSAYVGSDDAWDVAADSISLDGVDAIGALTDVGMVVPMFQNGSFYTDTDGSVYLI